MGQDILTDRQKQIINLVAEEPNLANFYLTGGTALAAYHLYHRFSDDLDFFIQSDPDDIFLHGFIKNVSAKLLADKVRFERRYDRRQFFILRGNHELKIEFTKYPFQQRDAPIKRDGIHIDSLRDIAANKLMAMLDRFEPKDFADLFFILKQKPMDEIREDAEHKFGITISPIFLGSELTKALRIESLPKMLKPLTVEELKSFFIEYARSLAPEVLKD